ncbi:MAG: S8 family serine peptidase [Verrucomicrobia bacterium]|nr:S8 family serine peptidase [Verrucomicrobiota bacterium]
MLPRNYLSISVLLFLLTSIIVSASEAFDPLNDYAEDHIIVKFRPGAAPAGGMQSQDVSAAAAVDLLGLPAGAELSETKFGRLTRAKKSGGDLQGGSDALDLTRHVLLKLPAGMTVEQCLADLKNNPALEYAEPDYIATGGEMIPDDTDFGDQWQHLNTVNSNADMRTTFAWDITQGSTDVVVAVLDTGLNTNLTDFLGRTISGYDFVNNDDNPADDHNHGTTVSGTLGATGNNANQLAGVDWNCRIMPVKVLNSGNSGTYVDIADGIDWAVANGADVISMSIGGSSADITLSNAVMNAVANGVVFICITHNYNTAVYFPGSMHTLITLGASENDDERWTSSCYGPQTDLIAPGASIRVILKNGTLSTWSGTSYACPLTAGTAALIKSFRPELEQRDMEQILRKATVDEVGRIAEDVQGFDNYHGSGRLDIYAALRIITNMGDGVFRTQYTIDGNLTLQEQTHGKATNGMTLYADFNGEVVYVAAPDAGEGNDHFIFVTDDTSASSNAPWAKAGAVHGLKYFVADENDGAYDAWFEGDTANTNISTKTSANNGGVVEAEFNVVDVFGYIPSNIYVAVAPYGTADGGSLVSGSQVPAGNADGNIDSDEYYVLNIGTYDTDGDGLTDLEEDADADGIVDSDESSPFVIDTDGDGLGDGDEVSIYGSDPSKVDTDGDGLRDDEEVVAGTDPDDANDRFMGVAVPASLSPADEFHFQWDGLTGRIYSVYYSAGPLSPTGLGWMATSYADVPGIAGIMTYTNSITSVTARYFKVHVSLP